MTAGRPRLAGLVAGGALLAVYVTTLAPGLTLWDAGEFAVAAETLGIPHPPGTPLYVLVARAWRLTLPFLSTVQATNLLAAVCTAIACGLMARLLAGWTGDIPGAIGGGIAAGAVSTVWLSATETEVYSAALLLSVGMVWAGNLAVRSGRHLVLLAYLMSLAAPLHLSALVASPAAGALASVNARLSLDVPRAALIAGAAVLVAGVGTVSLPVAVAGLAIMSAGVLAAGRPRAGVAWHALALSGVILVGSTAFAVMLLRARHDPALNQGNPATWSALLDVVARRQYDVPGLWPRQAPLWLQLGNVVQYADWQVALGLDRAVGASWRRTPFTLAFVVLGITGSLAHRRVDRRSWFGVLVLLASATAGVALYLNLKAGPSYGYGVLPADATREARERDYFFALGFMTWGAWAGHGAVALARSVAGRVGIPPLAWGGVVLAALPIVLNWRTTNRRRKPAATLPSAFAAAMLRSVPQRGVLFVAGDNDTYPLWHAQVTEGLRRDVTVVTVPLLGARWYRAELARRDGLYRMRDTTGWRGTRNELASIASLAVAAGRPVVASAALGSRDRDALGVGASWRMRGLVYLREEPARSTGGSVRIDPDGADSTAEVVAALLRGSPDPRRLDDPSERYLTSLLMCPSLARAAARGDGRDTSRLLDSRCNFR